MSEVILAQDGENCLGPPSYLNLQTVFWTGCILVTTQSKIYPDIPEIEDALIQVQTKTSPF